MKRVWLAALVMVSGCSPDDPGVVADAAPVTPDAAPFTAVKLDPNNTTGFQFESTPFAVEEGQEVQDCYFVRMPDLNNGQDYYMDHFRIGVNPGSHHVNVFRIKTIVALDGADGTMVRNGECFKSVNWADWPLVVNSQQSLVENPYFDWHLPEGVAQKFSPGERLMVQTHFVNAATQETPFMGKAVVDMYRSTLANPIEMGTLFATQQSIRVCRSTPTPTYHGTCAFRTGNVHVAATNGHFHSRGKQFDVFSWDGTSTTHPADPDMFYRSTTWAEPPMTIYDTETSRLIGPGGGIWWDCAYQWSEPAAEAGGCDAVNAADKQMAGDCCYTFGGKVETSEHCNVFLYYWPKVDRSDITCF